MNARRLITTTLDVTKEDLIEALNMLRPESMHLKAIPQNGYGVILNLTATGVSFTHTSTSTIAG